MLGNGKTIFTECLANELSNDYNVFFINNLESIYDDLELVLENRDKNNILVLDDYGYYIRLLMELAKDFPSNVKLILTCRTAININLYYDLTTKYGYSENDIMTINIDNMKNGELYELVNVLNKSRLWGNYDNYSNGQKKKILMKYYHSNMSKIFYLLLKSEIIKKQIKKLIDKAFEKKELKTIILAQSINSICNLKLQYYDICKFVNISSSLIEKYSLNSEIREIVDFNNGDFNFSSSIFSQYIVKQGEFGNEIIDMLKTIYIESSKADYLNKYRNQRKMLISRSNIKLIFAKSRTLSTEEENSIFKYFDVIKNTATASVNPFFWLQFGITALNLNEYDLASIYFENAYSNISELDNFDAYQLDTHKARLILNREMDTNRTCKEDAIKSFYEAHYLLVNNSNTGKNLSYVLKQTGDYYKYYNIYKDLFDDNEKNDFLKKAYAIKDKYKRYFEIKDIYKLPFEVVKSYTNYRKLFDRTKYAMEIMDLDKIFNTKVPDTRNKVYRLSNI